MNTHTASSARWLVRLPASDRPGRTRRVFCFPHGGGAAAEYIRWARGLRDTEFNAVQLPGRSGRIGQEPFTDMTSLVDALVDEVTFTPPYTLFGHSLGALIAYELAHALRAAGHPLPERLLVSSYPAPHLPRQRSALHRLPDDELLDEVGRRHGGIPPEVLAHAELREAAAHCLRADYTILETYTWQPRAPLPVPVTVLGGRQDPLVTPEQLAAWDELTTVRPCPVRTFPGGHFYLRQGPQHAVHRLLTAEAPC